MKTASATAAAYTVMCVACRDVVPEPKSGSHMWEPDQSKEKTVKCPACGAEMKLPGVLIDKDVR